MCTNSFEATVNPGRFRRQKATVTDRVIQVRTRYETIREQQQEAACKLAFDRACLQDLLCKIKEALKLPVQDDERPVWPEGPCTFDSTAKTFTKEYVEQATRYFAPMTIEEFDYQFRVVDQFWTLSSWIRGRLTVVETLEFNGPWYNVPSRLDGIFPQHGAETYFLDPARVDTSNPSWKEWKLIPLKELLKKAIGVAKATSKDTDGLNSHPPEGVVWNGMGSEHFTPRLTYWTRFKKWWTSQ